MTLPDYLDIRPERRTQCPYCKSHGFAVYHSSWSQYPTGRFYCHACHEGGDGLCYVMECEGRTFDEALGVFGLRRVDEPQPDWAFRGPQLRKTPLVLVDKAHELDRAAQRTLHRSGGHRGYIGRQWDAASPETRQACRDIVKYPLQQDLAWLRGSMTHPERKAWDANQRHGVLALPARLRSTDAAGRLDAL